MSTAIKTVAGSNGNAQLKHAITNRLAVAKITDGQTPQTNLELSFRPLIAQAS